MAERRVALATPSWPAGRSANGIVTYTGMLRPALQAEGARALILTRNVDEADMDEDVIRPDDRDCFWRKSGWATRLGWRINGDFVSQRRWLELLEKTLIGPDGRRRADIIEIPDTFGRARGVARRLGIPVVVRLHGPWCLVGAAENASVNGRFEARIHMEGRGIAEADGVTAPSQNALDETRRHYGLELEMAETTPTPIAAAAPDDTWRLEACDKNVVLCVGRFDRLKGGDVMVDAFRLVNDRFPESKLVFAGGGAGVCDEAGRRWGAEDYVNDRMPGALTSGRVVLLGKTEWATLNKLRGQAFVTVVPSRYETFGNTAAEALAMGCPVIASAAGGLPEIIQQDRNGLLFSPGASEELAERIIHLFSHPEYAARLGAQGYEDAKSRYDPGVVARKTLDFYERVIASAASRGRSRVPPRQ